MNILHTISLLQRTRTLTVVGLLAFALVAGYEIKTQRLFFPLLPPGHPYREIVTPLAAPRLERGDLVIAFLRFHSPPPLAARPLLAVVDNDHIAVHEFIPSGRGRTAFIHALVTQRIEGSRLIWRNWSEADFALPPVDLRIVIVRDPALTILVAIAFLLATFSIFKNE